MEEIYYELTSLIWNLKLTFVNIVLLFKLGWTIYAYNFLFSFTYNNYIYLFKNLTINVWKL